MSSPSLGYYCPECSAYNVVPLPSPEATVNCAPCGHATELRPSPALVAGGPVDRCPQCENLVFYLRKDFPQQLGCAAVSATVILSTLAYARWGFLASLVVLVVATVADFLLYLRLAEVTVCYRCHAELRGFAPNPDHGAFDMHRAEEYQQGK